MQASRLLTLLMLLQARGRMTAAALAQATEVSVRTILRDMDQLSAAGVPLWGERGRQGGFQLRPGWSTQLTGMTEPEAQALLLAGLPGPATELGLGGAAASARLKMLASLPSAWREQADRVGERLHIDPVDWYRAADTPRFLHEVAHAVWHGLRLQVDYQSWQGRSTREIDPLGLVLKAGAWYLVAALAGDTEQRTYRLASMHAVRSSTRRVKRPRGFDLAASWRQATRRFEQQLRPVEVRLRVSPRALGWLGNARLQFVPAQASASAGPAPTHPLERKDWQEVLLEVESIEAGARQVLGFGAEAEAIGPPALRRLVQTLAAQMARAHRYAARVAPRGSPRAAAPPLKPPRAASPR
jgi:predicted DNA-binding transcriptional regulator YafY